MNYDIIIVGGGVVGATAALALAKNTSLKIGLIDSQVISREWNAEKQDQRVNAISLASQRIFQELGIWEDIQAKRVSSYQHMYVWEENEKAKIQFDCSDINEDHLGYIIEENVIRTSLYQAFQKYSNLHLHFPVQLKELHKNLNGIKLIAADGTVYSAQLLIAADGAHSWVRENAGISLKTYDYDHTAIVTTVKTALSHQATAWQCFLKKGPLAFLPLQDPHTSSIVWSTEVSHANDLLAMDDETFRKALGDAFENKLGDIVAVDARYSFPLQMRHAKNYVQDRIALIGDAVHTIHPLAGQGVNLGLLDAACLVDVIIDALEKSRRFYRLSTLRRYERWRKGDNLIMLSMVEILKQLFSSDKKILQAVRHFGLNLTDRNTFIKNFFTHYASGNKKELPRLARERA